MTIGCPSLPTGSGVSTNATSAPRNVSLPPTSGTPTPISEIDLEQQLTEASERDHWVELRERRASDRERGLDRRERAADARDQSADERIESLTCASDRRRA